MKQKLSEEIKTTIKEMYAKNVPIKEIAKHLHISNSGVSYWLGDNRRKRIAFAIRRHQNFSTEKKKAIYQKQKEYQAKYFKERYWNNAEFRAKVQERCRNFKREHR